MEGEARKIFLCPSCRHRYKGPKGLEGRRITCKECGVKFKVNFDKEREDKTTSQIESAVFEKNGEDIFKEESEKKKVYTGSFLLTVTEDRLSAFINPKEGIANGFSLEDIKELLKIKKIKSGIIDDRLIKEYLQKGPCQQKPLKIARGEAPEPAQEDKIKYFFDTNSLKIGTIKEGGVIDYKDRGEIPQIKEGNLLAEKITGRQGKPGIDVFSNSVPSPKPKNVKLRYGSGAKISEDRLKAYAKINGRPELLANGDIVVFSKYVVDGDVGLETGHVDFDGEIEVKGSIQEGFRVKGGKLSAEEIVKAEIDIAGDIVIFGGIIGAKIKTRGNIRAMYIHGSEIDAMGDVAVEKELFDSKIMSSGACLSKDGKIFSSSILAKKGIVAGEIGSDRSRHCKLTVGFDERTKKEINQINDEIRLKKEKQTEITQSMDELQKKYEKIDKEVMEIAQVQDRAMLKKKNLKEKPADSTGNGSSVKPKETEALIRDLESEASMAEKNLAELFDKQAPVESKITDLQDEIKKSEEEVEALLDKIEDLSEWSEEEKGNPFVKVHGTIFAGTHIKGVYSSLALKENYRFSMIREKMDDDTDAPGNFSISISRLK